MAIRPYNHPSSMTKQSEQNWFQKADYSEPDINRFSYMKPQDRDKLWQFKLKPEDLITANETNFLIQEQKFVNRPDNISFKFYGNGKYWWIIALRNEIQDPFSEFYLGRYIKIPDLNIIKNIISNRI